MKVQTSFEMLDAAKDGGEFWDVVVLAAGNKRQADVYRYMLDLKLKQNLIPKSAQYHVILDPPGIKIGGGGSTLYVLHELQNKLGDQFASKKTLLMSAGGFSQRMPSHSVIGKLFAPLPFSKDSLWQVFEFKLAAFLPLLRLVPPGSVYLTASDDLLSYELPDDLSSIKLPEPDDRGLMVALAHKSSLEIGLGHGVFVLEEPCLAEQLITVLPVRRVLQKPNEKLMREVGAVLRQTDNSEFVYTDSSYFMDHTFVQKLIKFYECEAPIQCELDCYGDFMQPLGSDPTPDYIDHSHTVADSTDELRRVRKALYDVITSSQLTVLALNNSAFYHLGTMPELIENLTPGSDMFRELELTTSPCSTNSTSQSTLSCCDVDTTCNVEPGSVLEFCRLRNVHVGTGCVLSLVFSGTSPASLPPHSFVHTVAVDSEPIHESNGDSRDTELQYVSLVSMTTDNWKSKGCMQKLDWLGASLNRFIENLGMKSPVGDVRVWELPMFPVCATPEEAFYVAVDMFSASQSSRDYTKYRFISAAETMRRANAYGMISQRDQFLSKVRTVSKNI